MQAARKQQEQETHLITGRVLLVQHTTSLVALDDGRELRCERAASCLIAPEPRDRVLVALLPEPFVLAVVTRSDQPARLVFDGDARIEAPAGRVDIAAEAGISVTTRGTFAALARKLSFKGNAGELFVQGLDLVARTATAQVDKLSLVATSYDAFVERVTARSKRVYRFVEELDQLRARHLDYRARHSAQITADNTVITAREVAKMDGEQVHIG